MGLFGSKKPPKPPQGLIHATEDTKYWGKLKDWSSKRIQAELSRINYAKQFRQTTTREYNAARWEIYNKYGTPPGVPSLQGAFGANQGINRGGGKPTAFGGGKLGRKPTKGNPYLGDASDDTQLGGSFQGLKTMMGGGSFLKGWESGANVLGLGGGWNPGESGYGSGQLAPGQTAGSWSVGPRSSGNQMFGGGKLGGGAAQPGGFTDPLDRYRLQHDADLASDRGDTGNQMFGGGGLGGGGLGGGMFGGGLGDPYNQKGQGTREDAEANQAMWDELDAAKTAYDAGKEKLGTFGAGSGLSPTSEGDVYWKRRLENALGQKRAELSLFQKVTTPETVVGPDVVSARIENQQAARGRKAARGGGSPRQRGVLDTTSPEAKEGIL